MSVTKLDLNVPILGAKGENVNTEMSLGQVISAALLRASSTTEAEIVKIHTWAMALGLNKPIEIDEGDKKTLMDMVLQDQTLPNITKAPFVKIMNKLEWK